MPYGALGLLSRSLAAIETLALERRGASVTTVSPDEGSLEAIGPNLMDSRPRARVIAAGLAQGHALAR
jgi:NTE family protein